MTGTAPRIRSVYRLDYPLYNSATAAGAAPVTHDPDSRIEEQPLGLFLQFAALPNGLFVYIDNDAEQICYEVRPAQLPVQTPDYFGILLPVAATADLARLLNSSLLRIELGYAKNDRAPAEPLQAGLRLTLDAGCLVFVNYCDEGLYLWEGSRRHQDFFPYFTKVFGPLQWIEQSLLSLTKKM